MKKYQLGNFPNNNNLQNIERIDKMDSELPSNISELLKYYMSKKQLDTIQLANKCNISPMKIVNIKNNYRTYSQQLLITLGHGLELSQSEIDSLLKTAGFTNSI